MRKHYFIKLLCFFFVQKEIKIYCFLVHQKYAQNKRPESSSHPQSSHLHSQSPVLGAPSQPSAVMPAHLNSQSLIPQAQPKQTSMPTNSGSRNSTEPSFSAVLRNLAKQQDIKDDDMGQTSSSNENKPSNVRINEKEIDMSRQGSSSRNLSYDSRCHTTIRHPSPEPPEKKVIVHKTYFFFYFGHVCLTFYYLINLDSST